MSNSLVIAGQVELLGGKGGVVSTNPRCMGAVFQLLPGQGYGSSVSAGTYDQGAPQPTTDFVASLLTDGERPQGQRASNRTITLPIKITAPSFAVLAGAREVLLELVDQQFWMLTWTRDQGAEPQLYPLVFDCFRANPTTVMWGGPEGLDLHPTGIMTLQFTALPYGRSDTQTQMSFASPIPSSPPPPPAPVVLDAFATINNPQCTQSTLCIIGPNSCFFDPGNGPAFDPDGLRTPLNYGQTFPSPLNLTSMTALQMWLGLASRKWWNHHGERGHVRLSIFVTLTDTNGVTLQFSRSNLRLPVSDTPTVPKFSRVSIGIPQDSTTFSYASVAAYSLVIINQSTPSCLRYSLAFLDALTAYPTSAVTVPVVRGNIYRLYGTKGTARTQVSAGFQAAPAPGTPSTFTTPGTFTYTAPVGTVYLKVEGIGGGGAGGGQTGSGVGGGGGGGEYAQEPIFAASPGQVISYHVGVGGSQGASPVNGQNTVFGPVAGGTQVLVCNGGMSAGQNSITGGVGGTGSTNPIHYPGGAGRTASGQVGGGGGSSASSSGVGNTPAGTANVVLTGSGSWLVPTGVTQVTVTAIGAGGGAGTGGVGNGCGGGGGESATQTFTVVPGGSVPYACGVGGAPGSSGGDSPGHDGTSTTFGPVSGTTLTAHPGKAGPSTSGQSVPGGAGGSGSTAPIHFNGGQGGTNGPYPGGGGSSAGPVVAGNNGSGLVTTNQGGPAPAGGGAGGNSSGPNNANGVSGGLPGGGGGGTWNSGFTAGTGGNGQITISYPGGAPTNNGAAAPPNGGAGGAGGATANTPGSAGTAPGGGGGGANSTGTAEVGGAGGNGRLIVTPYSSQPFKTLIVHRPKAGCHPDYMPMVSVGNGADVPDGTHFYTMPQPQTGVNGTFDGTYTIVLVASAFNTPANARTITVTVTQTEYSGGPSYSQSTVPVTVSPSQASLTGPGNQVNNGVLIAGVLTLPVKGLAYDNTGAFFQVSVADTNTSDRFLDCLLLDTQGQTLIINEPASGYINYYADEPDPLHDLGLYLGSQSGRPAAVSVVDAIQAVSGGPFTIEPRECLLFAYSADAGAPSIGLSYFDRYFFDRIST